MARVVAHSGLLMLPGDGETLDAARFMFV